MNIDEKIREIFKIACVSDIGTCESYNKDMIKTIKQTILDEIEKMEDIPLQDWHQEGRDMNLIRKLLTKEVT